MLASVRIVTTWPMLGSIAVSRSRSARRARSGSPWTRMVSDVLAASALIGT